MAQEWCPDGGLTRSHCQSRIVGACSSTSATLGQDPVEASEAPPAAGYEAIPGTRLESRVFLFGSVRSAPDLNLSSRRQVEVDQSFCWSRPAQWKGWP